MRTSRNLFANVLLSARALHVHADTAMEPQGITVRNLFPYRYVHCAFMSGTSGRLEADSKEEKNTQKSVWGNKVSTMSKEEFRKRLALLIGKSTSSSTSKTLDIEGKRSHSSESVWGNMPSTMTKAEFRKRLGSLTDQPVGSSASKTAEKESEIGLLLKIMKNETSSPTVSHEGSSNGSSDEKGTGSDSHAERSTYSIRDSVMGVTRDIDG